MIPVLRQWYDSVRSCTRERSLKMMNLFLGQHFKPRDSHWRYLHPRNSTASFVPVIAFGPTSFCPWKCLQWQQPEMCGADKLLLMMGCLHIKMNFVKLIGDWLTVSGWITALTQAEVTTCWCHSEMFPPDKSVLYSSGHCTEPRYS